LGAQFKLNAAHVSRILAITVLLIDHALNLVVEVADDRIGIIPGSRLENLVMAHNWVGQLWVAEWQLARDEMKRLHSPKFLGRGHVFRRKKLFFANMAPKLDNIICTPCKAQIFKERPPPAH
jgi:hypothetical protein